MRHAIRNWQTSLAGLALIVIAITCVTRGTMAWQDAASTIVAGVGLILARDARPAVTLAALTTLRTALPATGRAPVLPAGSSGGLISAPFRPAPGTGAGEHVTGGPHPMSDSIAPIVSAPGAETVPSAPETAQTTVDNVLQTIAQINQVAGSAGLETAKTQTEVSGALQVARQLMSGGHLSVENAFAGFLLAIEGGLIKL